MWVFWEDLPPVPSVLVPQLQSPLLIPEMEIEEEAGAWMWPEEAGDRGGQGSRRAASRAVGGVW